MGKRKHKDSYEHIKKKLRKYEERLRRYESSGSSSEGRNHYDWSPAHSPYEEANEVLVLSDSGTSSPQVNANVRSSIHTVDVHNESAIKKCDIPDTAISAAAPSTSVDPVPSTTAPVTSVTNDSVVDPTSASMPADILDVLGESKGKQEVFGPKIQEEISKRWGRILCEGLNKDQKKDLTGKILVPENFQLVKAPKLNPEIAAVVIESTRNRDKRLEKAQNQLGLGISALTSLISSLIDKDMDKMDIIKRLSESNQMLLDLHYESTVNRRKLISYSLDKKFQDLVEEVNRDSLLFGENLSDKIKASKSAEKSGLQIKKVQAANTPATKKTQQGNWKGSPRHTQQRGNRRGGAKSRPSYQPTKRSAPASDRYQAPPKTRSRQNPKTQ